MWYYTIPYHTIPYHTIPYHTMPHHVIKTKIHSSCETISYTVGFFSRKRPFSTEAQIELSYTVEKGLFRLRIATGGSSRKTRLFRLDPPVEKLSPKSFTRFFLTHRIVHPTTKHTPIRPHGHTPIPGTTLQYHTRR